MKIQVFESFSDIPAAVAKRCSYPAQANFFLSLDWFRCLYDSALGASTKSRIYCCSDNDGDAHGLLFCGVRDDDGTLYSLSNFYTMEFAPVALAESISASDFLPYLVRYIEAERPRWKKLDLRFMQDDMLRATGLAELLEGSGFFVAPFFMYDNWFMDVSGSDFDSYFSGRSSRLRNTIKRKENKLQKLHGYDIELFVEPGPKLDKAIEDYVSVYNSSWKNPEPFPDFSRNLIELSARLGLLRLGILYIESRPAAAQLWITSADKALIYKLAYDSKYGEFSAGSILSREMFRHAIDVDHVSEIDYGVGSENYKRDWMDTVRTIHGMVAFNTGTMGGLALSLLERAKMLVKQVRKPSS